MSLALADVALRVGSRWLLRDFSLAVDPGEVVTVMGPSGVGKSSLLAWVCGNLAPGIAATGHVRLDGVEVGALAAHRRRIGILFQDDLLFPHMSVGDNLLFGLHPSVRGRVARREAVAAALAEAELEGMASRDPSSLSGGQRARVALMRVLLSRPRALLLDEPFGRLDAALRERFRAMVFDTARARHLPVLLVTHDRRDAAGRVVILEGVG